MKGQRLNAGVWIALLSQLLMNAAGFMAFPFLTLYLSQRLRLNAVEIGTAMSVLLLSAKLLPVLTGPLADRIGRRVMIVGGILIRAAGFAGIVVFSQFPLLLLMALLIGAGGAAYDPAVSGVLAAQPPDIRPRVFTLHNQFLNMGAVGGPIAGGLLAAIGPQWPFLVGSVVFALMGLVMGVLSGLIPETRRTVSVSLNYRMALGHRPFLLFLLIMTLWWVLFAQLQISFPLQAMRLGQAEKWVSTVFTLNGLVGLAFAFVVGELFKRATATWVLAGGFLILAAGFLLVPVSPSIWWFLGCVVVYTLAETMILPGAELMVAGFATNDTGATFFGLYSLSWAIGGTVGNYAGSWLFLNGGTVTPWVVYALVAAAGAGALILFRPGVELGQERGVTEYAPADSVEVKPPCNG